MAHKNLSSAKKTKNDEFYTQYVDIQKEIEAYLDYDQKAFKGRVVYCNCDDPYESNFFKYFVLNFKKLGLKQLITTSYKPSPIANSQLELLGNDATLPTSKGRPKITANKFIINKVHDLDKDGEFNLTDVAEQLKRNEGNEWMPLDGDGDFRSSECIELLRRADIVVTNPPFSLFREYIKQLMQFEKKFSIIGSMNAISYKEVFPLIKENQLWLGATGNGNDMVFAVPSGIEIAEADRQKAARMGFVGDYTRLGNSCWFTNLDHGRRHQPLPLMTMKDNLKFSRFKQLRDKSKYDVYDNYDAIEVPFTAAIPSDFDGVMGVPISFLDKYNPDQFEIVGLTQSWYGIASQIYPQQTQISAAGAQSSVTKLNDGPAVKLDAPPTGETYYTIGKNCYTKLYARVLIKHKRVTT
jgi:Adenine-specific methyltransferase EcoRI